ncbi:MAG: heme exporter protein B [Halieaceae bacterium]|jgi:heme exporter protein B
MNQKPTNSYFSALLRRDILVVLRKVSEVANPLFFFMMVVAMFPLGMGPDPDRLASFAPGVIWIVALLSTLLAADSLFRSDYEDGCLEQLVLSPQPLFIAVLTRLLAHWLLTGVPLTLLAPVLALMLQLPAPAFPALIASLLIGSAVLTLLAGIGAALTVSLSGGGVLISLLILPLYVPVLIFGSGAVQAAANGSAYDMHLVILAASLCLSVALAPLAIAAGLRISLDN